MLTSECSVCHSLSLNYPHSTNICSFFDSKNTSQLSFYQNVSSQRPGLMSDLLFIPILPIQHNKCWKNEKTISKCWKGEWMASLWELSRLSSSLDICSNRFLYSFIQQIFIKWPLPERECEVLCIERKYSCLKSSTFFIHVFVFSLN